MTSPVDASPGMPYRPDIDGLRAVAVTIVIAYHAFPKLVPGGFIGVDVFFAISGYLITCLILTGLEGRTFRFNAFYQRRVRRIVPALLLVLVSCGLFGWFVLLPGELRWLGQSLAWCAPFLANIYFAKMGSYFDTATELNPLLHLWSLGVEEQFYLVWPVVLWVAMRRDVSKSMLAAVIAASLALSIWGISHSPGPRFYQLSTRAWELGAGGMLAALHWHKVLQVSRMSLSFAVARPRGDAVISLLGLILIGGGALLLDASLTFPGAWGLIPTCGALLLIAARPQNVINRVLLGTAPMTFIGRISYPLYLWHWPALSFARIILGRPPSAATAVGAILFSAAAAYLTHRFVETPVRYGSFGHKSAPALLAGLCCVALAGVAVHVHRIQGRLSGSNIAVLDEAIDDWHYPDDSNFGKASGFRTLTAPSHRMQKALFVGDSHVEQYWSRVNRIIETHPDAARSALFATYIGCPPLPGINSPRHGWSCNGFFDYVMQQALQKDVDTVAFGAFWEVYLLGEFSSDTRLPIYSTEDPSRTPLGLDSRGTQLALAEFRSALSKLVASGRRVFIVLSNPTSPFFDPISLFPAQARLSPGSATNFAIDKHRQTVDVESFERFIAPVMSKLREIAEHAGATVIDPRSALCDGMICAAIASDGTPLYLDSNHLRPFFARESAVFIDQILLGPPCTEPAGGSTAALSGPGLGRRSMGETP